jgi:hypothetical protein
VGARTKLNKHHIIGAIGVAAILGGLAGSWAVFAAVAAALIAGGVYAGEIRGKSGGK